MARRGTSGLCGILAVDKESGPTSHDVVSRVRRLTGERRVGHGGTLDPLASGLLVVAVGPATRLSRFFLDSTKSYRASFVFGTQTDTDDALGTTLASEPVPDHLGEEAFAQHFLDTLVGQHAQMPPSYSAIKTDGRKAYEVARSGGAPALSPRTVTIHAADLVAISTHPKLTWTVDLEVSKGTYIRAVARDTGSALGTVAHIGALRRTASGSITLSDAVLLDALEADPDAIASAFLPAANVLGFPKLGLSAAQAADVRDGKPLPAGDLDPGAVVALTHESRLLAVYRETGDALRAEVVIPGGCP